MNILLNNSSPVQNQLDDREDQPENDNGRLGERFAVALLTFYTSSALIISIWSAIVIQSGNIESGGPIGGLFHILKISGIV